MSAQKINHTAEAIRNIGGLHDSGVPGDSAADGRCALSDGSQAPRRVRIQP